MIDETGADNFFLVKLTEVYFLNRDVKESDVH